MVRVRTSFDRGFILNIQLYLEPTWDPILTGAQLNLAVTLARSVVGGAMHSSVIEYFALT
jgi:hypothetical protein